MKQRTTAVICLALALFFAGCGARTVENASPIADGTEIPGSSAAVHAEKIGNTADEPVAEEGPAAVELSAGKKPEEPGTGEYVITISKTRDALENGTVLPESEAVSIASAIAKSEGINGWINDVTRCAPSCFIAVEAVNEKALYDYCEYGSLEDRENVRSLRLTEESKNTINGIISNYIPLDDAILNGGSEADAAEASWYCEPMDTAEAVVRNALEHLADLDETESCTILSVVYDEKLTEVNLKSLIGSELAKKRGLTDAYLESHFAVVNASYELSFSDPARTKENGVYRCIFHMMQDEATGLWSIWDSLTPYLISEP